jgi:CPA2 family monovalent cation:H+ antiporter-2
MEELGLVGQLAVVLAAALAGGLLARALRLPTLLGYLAAGLLIGPYTPGFVTDIQQVQDMADLGVALLMFSLGAQLSFRELAGVRDVALFGGLLQVAGSTALGMLVGWGLGLDARASFLLGAATAISSSSVALRLLEQRGEVGSLHGRVAVGLSLVQDLSLVPVIVIIPALAGQGENTAFALLLAAGKAAGLLVAIYLLGTRVLPWLFRRVAATRSRELFLLTVVGLALGTAAVSFLLGLSLAFGAFLAGLLVSESEYTQETLAEVLPLREVFAVIFFVAVGMLIDPMVFREMPGTVLAIAAVAILGKLLMVTALVLAFGYMLGTALRAGLALAQMAEFSFVVASLGLEAGLLTEEVNSALLGAVLLSIGAAPFLVGAAPGLLGMLQRLPLLGNLTRERMEVHIPAGTEMVNHVVICGLGEAGRELVSALMRRGFRFLVIEQDPAAIQWLRRLGVPYIYGDATSSQVLERAAVGQARVVAVTLPDVYAAETVVANARRLAPRADIIARGGGPESHQLLRRLGANEVVHPEFEAGLELVRHTLHRLGLSTLEIQALLQRRRRDYTAAEQ